MTCILDVSKWRRRMSPKRGLRHRDCGGIIGAAVLFAWGLHGHARNCVLGTSGGLRHM